MGRDFVVLSASSRDIAAIAVRRERSGDYCPEGFCRAVLRGFRAGAVVDAGMATDSIAGVLDKLRKSTGKRFRDVYTCVNSASISVVPSSGTLLLSRYGRNITSNDVNKCVKIASIVKTGLAKEPLHHVVKGFSIDGDDEIMNPLGLEGVKLEARVNVITINASTLSNLSGCIVQAGFIPAGFVFSGLASAYRVLTESEMQEGIGLLDIGSDMTEVSVFSRGMLNNCRAFTFGTNGFLTETGDIDPAALEKMTAEVALFPAWKKARGIVVIGEGSTVDGLIESLERIFSLPAKAGSCIAKPHENLPPERAGYIGNLGILDHLRQEDRKRRPGGNIAKRGLAMALEFVDRYF
ncbi:MAG: hypothetical protein ABIH74_02150 [Candidatus Omnitrophota bacterium]